MLFRSTHTLSLSLSLSQTHTPPLTLSLSHTLTALIGTGTSLSEGYGLVALNLLLPLAVTVLRGMIASLNPLSKYSVLKGTYVTMCLMFIQTLVITMKSIMSIYIL